MTFKENRKNEHVEIAMAQMMIKDSCIIQSNINVDEVDLTSRTTDFDMTYPIYINAMTGGSEWTKQINAKLAVVARETD